MTRVGRFELGGTSVLPTFTGTSQFTTTGSVAGAYFPRKEAAFCCVFVASGYLILRPGQRLATTRHCALPGRPCFRSSRSPSL